MSDARSHRAVLRGAAPTVAYTAGAAIAGVLSGVVLARTLGPQVRGEFAGVVVWATVLAIGGDLGVGYAVSYHVAKAPALASGLWTQCLVFGLGVGAALSLLAGVILPAHLELSHVPASSAWLGLLSIPLAMAAAHQGYLLLGGGHLRDANLVRFVAPVVHGGGIALAAVAGLGSVPVYMAIFFTAQLGAFATGAWLCRARMGVRLDWRMPGLRQVLRFGLKAQLGTISTQLSLRLDQLMMSVLLPPSELGRYVVAVAVSSALAPVFTASALVVSRGVLASRSHAAAGAEVLSYLKLTLLAAALPAAGAIAICGWLVPRVFGEGFAAAVPSARLLLVAALFQGSNVVLGSALRSMGWPGHNTVAEGAGCAATAVLLVALLPAYGMLGAAAASLLAYGLTGAIQVAFTLRAARSEPVPAPAPATHPMPDEPGTAARVCHGR